MFTDIHYIFFASDDVNVTCFLPVVLILTPSTRLCDTGNHAGEDLQQGEDCKCWRTSPAHRGRVGTSWSAHYQRRSEYVNDTLYLLNRSMLTKTYSPLSKFNSCALIIISRTESGDAHSTTTVIHQQTPSALLTVTATVTNKTAF